jgi:hypothetical protein
VECWTRAILLCALLIGAGWIYFSKAQTIAEGYDTLGYVYASQRLVQGKGPTYCDEHNARIGPYFSLYAFQIRRDPSDCLYLGFPPGFPLLLALAQAITTWSAAVYYLVPFLGVGVVFLTYVLGAKLFDPWIGISAAILMALAPTFLFFTTSPWSDIPGTVFILAGLLLYLTKGNRENKSAFMPPLLGGALVGYSFWIRNANALIIIPLFLYTILAEKGRAFTRPSNYLFFGAIIVSALGILGYNKWYFGGYLTTSYSPKHGWYPWSPFRVTYAVGPSPVGGRSFFEGGKTLWSNFAFFLPLALFAPLSKVSRSRGWLLLAICLSFFGFYSFYAFSPSGVNARFLLPVFPFLSLLGVSMLMELLKKLFKRDWKQIGLLVIVTALLTLVPLKSHVKVLEERNVEAAGLIAQVRALTVPTEPEAVFLSYAFNDALAIHGERSVLNYRRIPPSTPEIGTYDLSQFEPQLVGAIQVLLEEEIPVYFVLDRDPSLWHTFDILESHFTLTQIKEGPPVYKVKAKS